MLLRKHYPILVPLIMLVLSVLACSEPYRPEPMRVTHIEADDYTPGKAYILVEGYESGYPYQNEQKITRAYETIDYGENWKPSDYTPQKVEKDIPLTANREILWLENRLIWSFPKATFRKEFFGFGGLLYDPRVSDQNSVSPADPTAVYVVVGTQGVLVGPNPLNPTDRAWRLTNRGIDLLEPIPLTITSTESIIGIILVALFIPPLPLMHAYLLRACTEKLESS